MDSIPEKLRSVDKVLLGTMCWLLGLWILYGGSVPYLDGGIDLVKVADFERGGFSLLFENWPSAHPPLKIILTALSFKLLGSTERAYSLVGFIFGIVAVISLFALVSKERGRDAARVSIVLLATSPLFASTGLFSLIDYILACIVIMSFATYSLGWYWLWGTTLTAAVLTKETGILLPLAFLAAFVFKCFLWLKNRTKLGLIEAVMPIAAICIYQGWLSFVRKFGKGEWSDWIFSSQPSHSATQTIINNVLTGEVFNPYATQNWLHLFVLNWQWLIVLFALSALVLLFAKMSSPAFRKQWVKNGHSIALYIAMSVFFGLYTILVLSFQTYTIPRYVLPAEVVLYIFASIAIGLLIQPKIKIQKLLLVLFIAVLISRFFGSIDPISRYLWGTQKILNQNVYSLHEHLSGNDGLTYNGQFLEMVRYRTLRIRRANLNHNSVKSVDCYFTFPDPNNDYKVLPYLGYTSIPMSNPCLPENL